MKAGKFSGEFIQWSVVLCAIVFIISALSLVTMLLWNWVMPHIILCSRINFCQAAGLLAIVSLITFDKKRLLLSAIPKGWLYE